MNYKEGTDLASFMRSFEHQAILAEYDFKTMKEELLRVLPDGWRLTLYGQCYDDGYSFLDFKLYI